LTRQPRTGERDRDTGRCASPRPSWRAVLRGHVASRHLAAATSAQANASGAAIATSDLGTSCDLERATRAT